VGGGWGGGVTGAGKGEGGPGATHRGRGEE
jgi:hypothetical protein